MNSKFFSLILDGRGRIRTARNNGDERGLSLRNRRAWYADDPPAAPATPPTPQTPAPEPEKSGADDSGEGDDKKTYDAEYVKKLRSEAAQKRTEARELKERLDKLEAVAKEREDKELTEQQKWEQLAIKREKELNELKADYEGKLQASLKKLIGKEFGLPDELVARLQGASDEELRADAAILAKVLGLDKPKPAPETPAETPTEPESQAARGQTTTTAVPGGQPVGRTDTDRRKDYMTGVRQSPIFQGGGVVNHGKSDLD
jgi:hypothetical protein